MDLRNEKGQTMVEYMLLLAVSISLIVTFLHSDLFKRLFGSQGSIGKMIKQENQFAYRHAFLMGHGADIDRANRSGRDHPSYYQPNGETRFFGPKVKYP